MNNTTLAGANIFTDKKNRTVYYHPLTKKAYIIDNDVVSKFYIYKNRFALLIVGMILLSEYFDNWLLIIPCAIVTFLAIEFYFQRFFFTKLRVSKKSQTLEKRTLLHAMVQAKEKGRVFLKAILFFAFAILLVVNAYIQKATVSYYAFSILVSLGSIYYGGIHLYGFFKILKA